jgi:hypothetical protein
MQSQNLNYPINLWSIAIKSQGDYDLKVPIGILIVISSDELMVVMRQQLQKQIGLMNSRNKGNKFQADY